MRITKRDVEEYIRVSLGCKGDIVELKSEPLRWRHVCRVGGLVSTQKPGVLCSEAGDIYYIHCAKCGRVIYYLDKAIVL